MIIDLLQKIQPPKVSAAQINRHWGKKMYQRIDLDKHIVSEEEIKYHSEFKKRQTGKRRNKIKLRKDAIENAIEKIMTFAKSQNLTIAPVRGKVIGYLKRARQNHYQALVRAGVVKDF